MSETTEKKLSNADKVRLLSQELNYCLKESLFISYLYIILFNEFQ